MKSRITFRRHETSAYDYDMFIDGEHVGFLWKHQGFSYGGKQLWLGMALNGTLKTAAESRRQDAAAALARLLGKEG